MQSRREKPGGDGTRLCLLAGQHHAAGRITDLQVNDQPIISGPLDNGNRLINFSPTGVGSATPGRGFVPHAYDIGPLPRVIVTVLPRGTNVPAAGDWRLTHCPLP